MFISATRWNQPPELGKPSHDFTTDKSLSFGSTPEGSPHLLTNEAFVVPRYGASFTRRWLCYLFLQTAFMRKSSRVHNTSTHAYIHTYIHILQLALWQKRQRTGVLTRSELADRSLRGRRGSNPRPLMYTYSHRHECLSCLYHIHTISDRRGGPENCKRRTALSGEELQRGIIVLVMMTSRLHYQARCPTYLSLPGGLESLHVPDQE